MALTEEWHHRIERWKNALWENCYRPLGSAALEGFVTSEQLSAEAALGQNFAAMPAGTRWGAKWQYGWFRAAFTLPPAAAGQRAVYAFLERKRRS